MSLPKMDVPIGVVEWEVFVPEQYNARAIDGNMIDARRFRRGIQRGDQLRRSTTPCPGKRHEWRRVWRAAGQIRRKYREARRLPGATSASCRRRRGVRRTGRHVLGRRGDLTAELPCFDEPRSRRRFDGSPNTSNRSEVGVQVNHDGDRPSAPLPVIKRRGRMFTPPSQNVVNLQARAPACCRFAWMSRAPGVARIHQAAGHRQRSDRDTSLQAQLDEPASDQSEQDGRRPSRRIAGLSAAGARRATRRRRRASLLDRNAPRAPPKCVPAVARRHQQRRRALSTTVRRARW